VTLGILCAGGNGGACAGIVNGVRCRSCHVDGIILTSNLFRRPSLVHSA
jgi:hypothetical protein